MSFPATARLRSWIFPATASLAFVLLGTAICFAGEPYFGVDLSVSHMVQKLPSMPFASLARGVSHADNNAIQGAVLIAVSCLTLLVLGARREACFLFVAVLAGQGLWFISGRIVDRPRPASPELVHLFIHRSEIDNFPSFPSGHTTHYTVLFGFLFALTYLNVKSPGWRWPLLVLFGAMVLTIGLARVYVGAHWITDVTGGYLLGSAVLATAIMYYRPSPGKIISQARR